MAYCGWAVDVNKIILDSTSVSVGDGAKVTDELEAGGLKKSRLTCSNPPDRFSVVMEFDFSERKYDVNGRLYTEIELFWSWYKNVHKFGTVPFQFPAILINSNRQKGYAQSDIEAGTLYDAKGNVVSRNLVPDTEYYCITSAVDGSKNGLCQQVSMTWETYATGVLQVVDEGFGITAIKAHNGYVEVVMSEPMPSYEPNSATWAAKYSKDGGSMKTLAITGCIFDGDRTATLWFDEFTVAGTYELYIDSFSDRFTVS